MKYGVVFPQTTTETDPVAIRDFVQAAEGAGFDHLLLYDHVTGAHQSRFDEAGQFRPENSGRTYTYEAQFHEPLTTIAWMAALTSSIRFVTSVLVLPMRQTVLVAKQAAEHGDVHQDRDAAQRLALLGRDDAAEHHRGGVGDHQLGLEVARRGRGLGAGHGGRARARDLLAHVQAEEVVRRDARADGERGADPVRSGLVADGGSRQCHRLGGGGPQPPGRRFARRLGSDPGRRSLLMELADLVTEQLRPELADLDLRSTAELVRLMADDQKEALEAVADAANSIAAAIEAVHSRLEGGGRLIYVGAGTAGRLGLLDAAECPPTFNTDRVIAVLAGGPAAFDVSREAVEDDIGAGADDMDRLEISQADVVVGLSASGRTPYTIGAVAKAKQLGAVTVGISCNPNALLSRQVDYPIEVLVGPEVIEGKTKPLYIYTDRAEQTASA